MLKASIHDQTCLTHMLDSSLFDKHLIIYMGKFDGQNFVVVKYLMDLIFVDNILSSRHLKPGQWLFLS